MKIVTLTFVVSDKVADDIQNDLAWGDIGNAVETLNANCDESDYDIEIIDL